MRSIGSYIGLLLSFFLILWVYVSSKSIGEKELLVYLLLFVLGICVRFLFKKQLLSALAVGLYSLLYALLALVEFIHADLFNSRITTSTISIFLETNTTETSEFLDAYIKGYHLFVIFIILSSIILSVGLPLFKKYRYPNVGTLGLKESGLLWTLMICLLLSLSILRAYFLPFQVAQTIGYYEYQKEIIESVEVSEKGDFENVSHIATSDEEVYVVIIGESTTRNHMSLYGYYRETNPLLEQRREELLVYKDVISPHTHTITSLEKVLSLGNYDDLHKKNNNTIVQLLNSANFETYWISNQRPVGLYETSIRMISRKSNKSIFTDISDVALDEKILDPLRTVLDEKPKKKFIVIHLMGTHLAYNRRYPESFKTFTSVPKTPFKDEDTFLSINEYDNAVRYNDSIVSEIINQVDKNGSRSFVLYLSDHGEEVYQNSNFNGHKEEDGTKPMYDIPFVLWTSNNFLNNFENLEIDTERPYTSEDFIHTLAHLSKIDFKGYEKEKSILHTAFKLKKRTISNIQFYEEVFNEE